MKKILRVNDGKDIEELIYILADNIKERAKNRGKRCFGIALCFYS